MIPDHVHHFYNRHVIVAVLSGIITPLRGVESLRPSVGWNHYAPPWGGIITPLHGVESLRPSVGWNHYAPPWGGITTHPPWGSVTMPPPRGVGSQLTLAVSWLGLSARGQCVWSAPPPLHRHHLMIEDGHGSTTSLQSFQHTYNLPLL